AKKYGKIIQTGTQCRSNKGMIDMVNYVHSGQLGKIQWIAGTCYKSRMSIGKRSTPLEIPKHIDYDRWCGPAQKVDLYRDRVHYDWHWDYNTGNGDMGNQGIHQMDLARWFLGADELSPEIISVGGRFAYEDAGNTPNTQVVCHNYKKAPIFFETRGLPSAKEFQVDKSTWHAKMDNLRMVRIGVIIQCEGGYMSVGSYSSGRAYDNNDKKIVSFNGGGDHFGNFIDAVRSRDRSILNADINEGHLSSALCHTGAISHQLGKLQNADEALEAVKATHDAGESFARMMDHCRANGVNVDERTLTVGPWLKMDPKTERFTNSKAANKLLKDQQRAKYSVPDLAIS
ncbi:MAG: gfo/Idh/MocA family oxidoreductase, partial [Planctomycetota bacterium]